LENDPFKEQTILQHWIWGSHSDGYQEFYLLEYNFM
jgi:hypothetical protein